MEALLIYIFQVNLLLAILTVGYYMLLCKLTFYKLNRLYFNVGILFSLVYPFLPHLAVFKTRILPSSILLDYGILIGIEDHFAADIWSIAEIIVGLLLIVGAVFVVRLFVQLLSIWRIYKYSDQRSWGRFLFRDVQFPIAPFSFLRHMYVHKPMHNDSALANILEHEAVHVEGRHTLDTLLAELLLACCWYNPFFWILRYAIRQNLEFLTDEEVLGQGVNRQQYQYALLLETQQQSKIGITNTFNFKQLKTRISMMNKQRSAHIALTSYIVLIPVLVATAGVFTVNKVDKSIKQAVSLAQETPVSAFLTQDTIALETSSNTIDSIGRTIGIQINREAQANKDFGNDQLHTPEPADTVVKVALGNPIYLVEGKEVTADYLKTLNPNAIESMTVYKDSAAYLVYGDRGKNGVVKLILKGKVTGAKLANNRVDTAVLKNKKLAFDPEILSKEIGISRKDTAFKSTTAVYGASAKEPLIILDGEIMAKTFKISSIDAVNIEAINVLKGISATTKYGQKAANGAIEITSKKVITSKEN